MSLNSHEEAFRVSSDYAEISLKTSSLHSASKRSDAFENVSKKQSANYKKIKKSNPKTELQKLKSNQVFVSYLW